MKETFFLAVKGMLMGAANVIPGVSGGTMALLTGIFEELILALRSFDLAAMNLLRQRRFKALADHIHLHFLLTVGVGIAVSILSFARLLDFLFDHYALYVWSFFFGLILVSVCFVWKRIRVRNAAVFLFFLIGTLIAAALVFVRPAEENSSFFYLFLCGAIAMCSMILPGLSGSYVLLLMGNYQLVMVDAVAHLRLDILLPVGLGAAAGLAAFARLLAWVFARFHDATTALLAGFIFGSLCMLWPWKTARIQTFGEKVKVIGYDYSWPHLTAETAAALGVMTLGMILLVIIEKTAGEKTQNSTALPR